MSESKLLSVALAAAKAAEKEILEVYASDFDVHFKADASPVTIADERAETVIRKHISHAFPDHGFLGEEYGTDKPDAEYVWVIDPIDGTKNFTRHIPFFGTEIALLHKGELVLGVSNLPAYKQISWAEKGQGAFCNGDPVHVSTREKVSEAYVSFSNLRYFTEKKLTDQLVRLTTDCYVSRGLGDSWAYHFVARGAVDAVVEAHVQLWDIAAVAMIIQEAGGRVTDLSGSSIGLGTRSVLATNGALHTKVLQYFTKTTY